MSSEHIRHVVILGGGTAGWMSAAALSKVGGGLFDTTLIESEEIGIVGVGEATIPTIHWFNQFVGLDAEEFMRATRATFKLGIEFVDWYRPGERYFHPFGRYGHASDPVPFHHRWIRARQPEESRFDFEQFALATLAARSGRFALPSADPQSLLSSLGYAFHFDASLYAAYLRRWSEERGVRRIEGKVIRIDRDEQGHVSALTTDKGARIEGELFIDCSGFRALLIGGECRAGFEDWSEWLPCDRALAVPCPLKGVPEPFTRSVARSAGWQWRIPLQHRIGNGMVYCSEYLSDETAADMLLAHLDAPPLAPTRPIRFKTGRRSLAWSHNVVAIGLSAGFLEPLESTSIHLIQSAIAKLVSLFPTRGTLSMSAQQFNRLMCQEYEGVRDFLILHYHSNDRSEPFWQHCRQTRIPESLRYKEEQFRRTGRLMLGTDELFREASWLSVLVGQNHVPEEFNPLLRAEAPALNLQALEKLRSGLATAARMMPSHGDVLQRIARTEDDPRISRSSAQVSS